MIPCAGPSGSRSHPFAGLVRRDDNGDPCVIPTGSLYVTAGTARRQTGTQYTPRTLTESVVEHALAPLVYTGPAEGQTPEAWQLKPAGQILDLKICDFACGSAAFLVAAPLPFRAPGGSVGRRPARARAERADHALRTPFERTA